MSDEPVRAEHCCIIGDSGSGKSTLGRTVHEKTDVASLVVDYSETGGYSGRAVSDKAGLAEQLHDGGEAVFRDPDLSPVEQCAVAMAYARDAPHPVQVIIEEAEEVMHYGNETEGMQQTNPVWWGLHQGRDDGVKVVIVTQDPQDLPYTPIKQVPYFAWCGLPAGFHDGWFNAHGWVPVDDLPDRSHRYVVFDKTGKVLYPEQGSAEVPK